VEGTASNQVSSVLDQQSMVNAQTNLTNERALTGGGCGVARRRGIDVFGAALQAQYLRTIVCQNAG
jgi:hypothetical protein